MRRFRLPFLISCFMIIFPTIGFGLHHGQMWAQTQNISPIYFPPTSPQELYHVLEEQGLERAFDPFEVILVGPKNGHLPYAKLSDSQEMLFRFTEDISQQVANIVHQARRNDLQLLFVLRYQKATLNLNDLHQALHYGARNQPQPWLVLLKYRFGKNGLHYTYQNLEYYWRFKGKKEQVLVGSLLDLAKAQGKQVLINLAVIDEERIKFLPVEHLIKLAD